ncbi:MAG: BMC domain-containing protein [Elusimicrobia bacterium]|nr:BMC domain-containing protein [Elusimicrobiota bacterium]
MQADIAIGLLETSSIAKGIESLDAMCKAAGIKPEIHQPISKGKYIIVVSGPVGEVESSMAAGVETAGKTVEANHLIRNVHKGVLSALNKRVKAEKMEAVGIMETREALPAVFAADAAAKAAFVHLVEVNTGKGIGGKGYFVISGEVGAVRSAINAAAKTLDEQMIVSKIVIPSAHKHLSEAIF